MKKKVIIPLIALVIIFIIIWQFTGKSGPTTNMIKVPVQSGLFKIAVTTTGELEAESSESIRGPENLRSLRIFNDIKINELVAEGTIVDSGDFVANLDRTEVESKLKDLETELEKLESQFTKTLLDTTLNLRRKRDDLVNLKFGLEERQIEVDQSKFEPPATQRQAKINLEKAERTYIQTLENYDLEVEKAGAEMSEVMATLQQKRREKDRMVDIMGQFTVYAPKNGMVIYARSWNGTKKKAGSTISTWDPVVATLPDLSQMIVKTYVNEIDISKVSKGQAVEIGVDAFPDKNYNGEVIEVANIGEQKQGSNAKVFEIVIDVKDTDTILRPAMTTKNAIVTAVIDSSIFIPLEALFNTDSVSYVFTDGRRSIIKQEIITGESNENEIIVVKGLKPDDEVYLTIPENSDELKIQRIDD
jgi:multidrug efflux pump subunit AcrA (membrane-fusion protein)